MEAEWYSSTSDDQGRKSYKLLPERVHVPIGSLVQRHGLEWVHEGRSGHESILSHVPGDLPLGSDHAQLQ